jgi:subtilisin family serine protease
LILLVPALAAGEPQSRPAFAPIRAAGAPALQADGILVAFHARASLSARSSALSRLGLEVASARSPHFVRLRLSAAAASRGVSVASTVAALRADPAVRVAEPDYIVRGAYTPNDPGFRLLWGLHNTGQDGGVADADIDAPEAWDQTIRANGVIVAVLDTGVDYTHPDLAANILRDGAGRLVGYDFFNEDWDPIDDHGHGTHISGTIAAVGNNGIGVVGVCPTAKIMPVKWLNQDNAGRTSDQIRATDFARELGARVINISAGGYNPSQLMLESLQRARAAGILVLAAAMNEGDDNDQTPVYPANYNSESDNVLAVAASDRADRLAGFSNYGARTVDLAAPGAAIVSTTPNNTYQSWDGTSMAAPQVAGAAALLLSVEPTLTYAQVKARLLAAVDFPPGLAGRVRTGRLNIGRAFEQATGDAWEPDNTPAQAREARSGQARQHTFHAPGDVDWVKFTIPAGARVTAATSQLAGETDTILGLVAPDGTTVLTADDDGGGGRASRLQYTCQAAGTYFVVVSEYGNRGGDGLGYTLTVEWAGEPPVPPDQWEPDNSAAAAREVRSGQAGQHTFHAPGDVDWVKFTVPAGARVTAATSQLAGEADTIIGLVAPDGNTVLASDDDGAGGGASRLQYTCQAAGTYFIVVTEYGNRGGAGVGYTLSVEWTAEPPVPPDQWEQDDSPAQASLIRPRQAQSHTFHVPGDADWVKFSARKGRKTFTTSSLTGETDTVLELYAADGTLLASDDDGAGGRASRLQVRFRRAGTYYLRVRDYNGGGGRSFGYQLAVR